MFSLKTLHLEKYPSYKDFFTQSRIMQLQGIMNEISKDIYFPDANNIFRFMEVPISEIKCVLLGMEPYPSWTSLPNGTIIPEATGRSFEVKSVVNWSQKFKQSSMRNILKSLYYLYTGEKENLDTIRTKINTKEFPVPQPENWFNEMEKQGVVFLNATLTVKKAIPDTHKYIWNEFMTDLIKYINEKNPNIKWILAGKQAQEKAERLVNNAIITHHPRLDSFVMECPFKSVSDVNWLGCKE